MEHRSTRSRLTLGAHAALAFASAGCSQDASRSEARAIVSAYEAFQHASTTDRQQALSELRRTRCTSPTRCNDRDACTTYATALVRATDLTARAHALGPVDAGGNAAATSNELAVIVQGAEEALRKAEDAEAKCQHALVRLYDASRR